MKVEMRDKIKREKMLRELSKDHRSVFEQKLQRELHRKSTGPLKFLMVAASVLMLFSLGYLVTNEQKVPEQQLEVPVSKVSLEEFSPELKKIENYYLTAISFEMANLSVTDENKMILDGYFDKMKILTQEYQMESEKLQIDKIDEQLINNLIDNLQMRLQLMIDLKNELKKLKKQQNEEHTI
jgi:hypothetical protein